MIKPSETGPTMRLAVDDAATAQAAGVRFARDLAGAHGGDFLLAVGEQRDLIHRAILDAGFSAEQAHGATEHFEVAALVEWTRLTKAMTGDVSGTA